MMKKLSKLALLAVAAAFLAAALPACSSGSSDDDDSSITTKPEVSPEEDTGKKSKSMTLDVSDCDDAESITAETRLNDDFSVLANASSPVIIDGNSKSLDGVSHTKRIKLGGAGDTTKRSVKFAPDGAATIKIAMMSSSSGEANIWAVILEGSESGNLQEWTDVDGDSLGSFEYNYTGTGETLYLYSKSGGLNIYAIYVN